MTVLPSPTRPNWQAQGQFTMVDVDSNQQWSLKWDTSRIENNIDPGTYTVYVVNAPVDKSNLAGHSYDTVSVYLKDPGNLRQGSVIAIYTLHPGRLTDDTVVATTVITTVPPTTMVPNTTATPLPTTMITSYSHTKVCLPAVGGTPVCQPGIGLIRVFSRKE